MTGIITLRSKFDPSALAQVIVASLPTTWAATIITASGITGLTLPGMIELPGWSSGMRISPIPHRGPEARKRMLLAMNERLTATVLRAPETSTAASRWAMASNGFDAGRSDRPVSCRERGGHPLGELGVRVDSRPQRRAADRQLRQRAGRGARAGGSRARPGAA